MVDEYINCEDIAMNFLVSHITRKPPIKVGAVTCGKVCARTLYSCFCLRAACDGATAQRVFCEERKDTAYRITGGAVREGFALRPLARHEGAGIHGA